MGTSTTSLTTVRELQHALIVQADLSDSFYEIDEKWTVIGGELSVKLVIERLTWVIRLVNKVSVE